METGAYFWGLEYARRRHIRVSPEIRYTTLDRTCHDFHHFRASQWVMRGVDIRSVQEMLGHADIQTTMRYAHFAPNHALRSVIEAQRREKAELAADTEAAGNK